MNGRGAVAWVDRYNTPVPGPARATLDTSAERTTDMRILILGGDGYLGWATAMHFSKRGHEVHAIDNYLRRRAHREQGTDSLTPILESLPARARAWKDVTGLDIGVTERHVCEWDV